MQAWVKNADSGKWALVQTPGQGDLKLPVPDFVKQQDVHTQSVLAQKHSLMMKQLSAKVTRTVEMATRQAEHLQGIVAAFKADPSAGASKVWCPLLHR